MVDDVAMYGRYSSSVVDDVAMHGGCSSQWMMLLLCTVDIHLGSRCCCYVQRVFILVVDDVAMYSGYSSRWSMLLLCTADIHY